MSESTESSTERSPFTKPGFITLAALVIALPGALMIFLLPKGDRTTQRRRTLNDALKLVLGRKSVHQRHVVAASREAVEGTESDVHNPHGRSGAAAALAWLGGLSLFRALTV